MSQIPALEMEIDVVRVLLQRILISYKNISHGYAMDIAYDI